MRKKLYVSGLPYRMDNSGLEELFSEAGTVSEAAVITDKMTSRSKGYGFVTMSSDEEAERAIEKFNEYVVDGRTLRVEIAMPKKSPGLRLEE